MGTEYGAHSKAGKAADVGESGKQTRWIDLVKDKVILLLLLSYIFGFFCVAGKMFITPVLLGEPSFGLVADTQEETQANIAKTQGFISAPSGVLTLLAQSFLYLPMSRRLGEAKMVIFAGSVAVANTFLTGFVSTKIWHLVLFDCCGGLMLGLILPVLSPLVAQYANKRFPEQQAQAQGLPMLGLSLGMALGQPIAAAVHSRYGIALTYVSCACN